VVRAMARERAHTDASSCRLHALNQTPALHNSWAQRSGVRGGEQEVILFHHTTTNSERSADREQEGGRW
jgi:hypothetical protein